MNLQLTLCNIEQIMVLKLDNLRIGNHISEAAFIQHLNTEYNNSVKKMALDAWEKSSDMFCEITMAKDLNFYPTWSILNLPEQTQAKPLVKFIETIIRSSVGAARMMDLGNKFKGPKGVPILFSRSRSHSDPNLEMIKSPQVSRKTSQSMNSLNSVSSEEKQNKDYCFKL